MSKGEEIAFIAAIAIAVVILLVGLVHYLIEKLD